MIMGTIYISTYLFWCGLLYLVLPHHHDENKETKNRGVWFKNLATLGLIIFRGLLFSADGFVSSRLKTPFGQICYAINKSDEISEEDKDNLVNEITESNEHCKETFKKFGVLTLVAEADKIFSIFLDDKSNSSIKSANDWFIRRGFEFLLILSFLIPFIFSYRNIVKVSKKLKENWEKTTHLYESSFSN